MGETMPEVEPSRRQPWRGRQAVAQMTIRRDPRGFELWHYTRTRRSFKAGASAARTGLPAQGLALSCWEQLQVTRGGDSPLLDVTRPTRKELGPSGHLDCPCPTLSPTPPTKCLAQEKTLTLPKLHNYGATLVVCLTKRLRKKLDLTSNFWHRRRCSDLIRTSRHSHLRNIACLTTAEGLKCMARLCIPCNSGVHLSKLSLPRHTMSIRRMVACGLWLQFLSCWAEAVVYNYGLDLLDLSALLPKKTSPGQGTPTPVKLWNTENQLIITYPYVFAKPFSRAQQNRLYLYLLYCPRAKPHLVELSECPDHGVAPNKTNSRWSRIRISGGAGA